MARCPEGRAIHHLPAACGRISRKDAKEARRKVLFCYATSSPLIKNDHLKPYDPNPRPTGVSRAGLIPNP